MSTVELFGPVSCPADVTDSVNVFTSFFVPYLQTAFQLQLVLYGNRIAGPLAYRIGDLDGAAAVTPTNTRREPSGMRRPHFALSTGPDNVLAPGEYRLALLWSYRTVDIPTTYTARFWPVR